MSAAARIAGFALLLGATFAVAALAGRAADVAPRAVGDDPEPHAEREAMEAPRPVGLSLSDGGLTLVPTAATLRPGVPQTLAFRIDDERGQPVRAFDVEHEKRMHVIVVRRDLTGYRHLHPTMSADGRWSTPITLPDPGAYRLFADFTSDGVRRVLGVDLSVPGQAVPEPLPAAARRVDVAGLTVSLHAPELAAGRQAMLAFRAERDGRALTPEPYLGARGHLVVLREGDLAYVHAHPEADAGGTEVAFESTFPSAGRYRLFLQLSLEGRVVTIPFTVEVAP